MYEHILSVEKYIGREITKIKAEQSFDYLMFDKVKTRGKNAGKKGYGWPSIWCRWCTRELKQKPTKDYLKHVGEYKQYLGIAYDEPKRHERITEKDVHPLYNWGVTEAMALQYCYAHGFDWGGLYKIFRRVSCWCCPLQPLSELRKLYKTQPMLWKQLRDMDDKVEYKFSPNGKSIRDYENRFLLEECQGKLY